MSTDDYRPSRADRFATWSFIILGAIIVGWVLVHAVLRTIDLLSPGPIDVPAEFLGTIAQAPIGEGGSDAPVALDSAVLTVAELPAASVVAGVLEQALLVATVATVVTCLILVTRGVLRGEVFSKRNTRLVATAGIVGLVGAAAVPFFGNMVANGAFSSLGDFEEYAVMSIEPFPFVLAAFAIATVATAFTVGEKLQRETEGLV
ncbi:MAG TPA: hypothetical protein VN035_10090 [Microbacterium sp.]|nr:hypothetical protein [Microbacterium sp.]